ncbi:MAG: hypothetical protein JNK89_08515 [Saprospiraceae bacterium]|nr:hypothetical protein [Saprospiraceae bacterium]
MKNFLLFLCLLIAHSLAAIPPVDSSLNILLYRWELEKQTIRTDFAWQEAVWQINWDRADATLRELESGAPLASRHIQAMLQRDRLLLQRRVLEENKILEMTRARFRKGLEIIKLIYEKTLSLEHHFSSLKTYNSVAALSNPNSFPEFQKSREMLEERLKKKTGFRLPQIMQSNPFLSAAYTVAASLLSSASDGAQKDKEMEKISCILDFTVRMNADLNTIYYETEFLKESNRTLKEECKSLFSDFTKPVGYLTPLDICRKEDDWETLYAALDKYIAEATALALKTDDASVRRASKMRADLEFQLDRLLVFINNYGTFVAQGEKYYQKFQIIISNYSNETVCAAVLPVQFAELKSDISHTIEKFSESYNLAEIRGSRLKDLVYGEP